MVQSLQPATKALRSRGGCTECRRRHRRCDEAKPACGYCTGAAVSCSYARGLSWGGRSFRKSRFGACGGRDSQVVMIMSGQGTGNGPQFVYGARPSTNRESEPSTATSTATSLRTSAQEHSTGPAGDMCSPVSTTVSPPACGGGAYIETDEHGQTVSHPSAPGLDRSSSLSAAPELAIVPERFRPLLAYFQHAVSQALSCHAGIRHDLCTTILPASLQSPHLLAAVLCAAACHRRSAGLTQDADEIAQLRSTAIQSLRFALALYSSDATSTQAPEVEAALGTSLVLCVCEIVLPEADRGTWRLYLAGASALLGRLRAQDTSHARQPGRTVAFMERLHRSLLAIALGCRGAGPGSVSGVGGRENENVDHGDSEEEDYDESLLASHYIDDLAGFSTALLPVFRAIDRLDCQQESTETLEPAQRLVRRVRMMLAIRSHSSCHPDLDLSEPAQTDFYLLDEAYHHMALLQLYRHSHPHVDTQKGLDPATQASICRIVSCIADMRMVRGPCPGVAALPPLFTAGRTATTARDRERILALLQTIWSCFGMGNVVATQAFLQQRWSEAAPSSAHSACETWEFLPY